MAVKEKEATFDTALFRYRIGLVLIWIGVLTWLPFIMMRANGIYPSIFWFLPFHLVGVVGGSRMRAMARRKLGEDVPQKNVFRTIGHYLIFLAISIWGVYFYLKLVAGQPMEVGDFLPYHLTGIFGGIAFLGVGYLVNRRETP